MSPPISLPTVERRSLDNSVMGSLSRCPRLAFYNYRLARAPRAKSWPIQFGNGYHSFRDILERAYIEACVKGNKTLNDAVTHSLFKLAFSKALSDTNWEDPPVEHKKSYLDKTRLYETCEASLEGWVQEKEMGFYKIISTEAPFEVPLPSGRPFSGKIDQLLEWNGRLWLRDFKTCSRKEDFKKKFNPRHQFTGYAWAAQKMSGRKIEGVIIENVYNTKNKGPEFYPTLATRNSGDYEHWLEWAEDKYDEWERRSESGIWVMQTTACNDYGGCFFRDACNTGNWNDIERFLEEKTIHSVWDPLEPELEEGLPE